MPSQSKQRSQPKREFTVVIEKGDDGYFFAYVPELRACQTQAKSIDKLLIRIREVIELCLETQMDEAGRSEFVGIQKVAV